MATEADFKTWTPAQLQPYVNTVLEAFGPQRLMFGSDWPVCLVACEYARWRAVAAEMTSTLSEAERREFWSGTATRAYGLC